MTFLFLFPVIVVLFVVFVVALAVAVPFRQRKRQREYWQSLPLPWEQLPESPECPRCQSGMVRGYLLDRFYGGYGMGMWLEGSPADRAFSGARLERYIPIVSYRCTGCGHLELYARPDLFAELDASKPAQYPEL